MKTFTIILSAAIIVFQIMWTAPMAKVEISSPSSVVKVVYSSHFFSETRSVQVLSPRSNKNFEFEIPLLAAKRFQVYGTVSSANVLGHSLQMREVVRSQIVECYTDDFFVGITTWLFWILRIALIAFFAARAAPLVVKFLKFSVSGSIARFRSASISFDRWLSQFQSTGLLKLDTKLILVVAFYFITYVTASFLHMNGSSLGILSEMFDGDKVNSGLIYGSYRPIRSDEWTVVDPWLFAQEQMGFAVHNPNVGGEKSPVFVNIPSRHYTTFFKPQFFAYLFTDGEPAYSFFWNFKLLALLLGSLLFFLIISRQAFWIAWPLSVALSFSSFLQWWFSSLLGTPELLFLWFGLIISILYFIFSKSKPRIFAAAAGTIYFAFGFILGFYPPFQIPLAYVAAGVILGFYLDQKQKFASVKTKLKWFTFAAAAVAFTGLIGVFVASVGPSMKAVLDLDYPGHRVSAGGGYQFLSVFFGFFDVVYTDNYIPAPFGNICEASQFILFYPALILIALYDLFCKVKVSKLLLIQLFLCVFFSGWILFGYPPLIAKMTLLDRVSATRAEIAIGISSFICCLLYLSPENFRKRPAIARAAILVISLVGLGLLIRQLNTNLRGDIPWLTFVPWMIVLVALTFFLVQNWSRAFAVTLGLAYFLINYTVNPIVRGVPFLKTSPVLEAVSAQKDKTWLVFAESSIPAQFLKLTGTHVIGGINFLPNPEEVLTYDPDRKFKAETNRYAHIRFLMAPTTDALKIENDRLDGYLVRLPLTKNLAKQMHLDFVVFYRQSPADIASRGFHLWRQFADMAIYEIDRN